MKPIPFLLGLAGMLAAGLSCGQKDVICHGPGCSTATACEPEGCPPTEGVIYRSVGPGSASALALGDANPVRIVSGVATFEAALPDRIGVGDALVSVSGDAASIAFVSRRWSATEYGVQTADGGVPPDSPGPSTKWSIYRAYTSLVDAASRIPNAGIPAALAGFDGSEEVKDLTAAGKIWAVACYADATDSADAQDVWFDSRWTTDREHYLRIFAPSASSEVGIRQRHSGRYDPSRYELRKTAERDTDADGILFVDTAFVRVEGLQITDRSGSSADTAIHSIADQGGELRIAGNLIRGNPASAAETVGISVYGTAAFTVLAWNNVVAGFTRAGVYDNTAAGTAVEVRLYNDTFYACGSGVEPLHARVVAVNDVFGGVPAGGSCVAAGAPLDATSDYNVCPLAEVMTGAHSSSGATATWIDAAAGDFHLAPADTAAAGKGADLSADAALPFEVDFEGEVRSGAWDVGADQR